MTFYELLKFLHIVAVIAWFGSAIGLFLLQGRLGAVGDQAGAAAVGRQGEWFGKSVFAPTSIVTLVTGIWMVATTDALAFGDLWILVGLAGVVITTVVGMGLITPTGRKMLDEGSSPQPDRSRMGALQARIRTLTLANMGVLLVVVWAMVVRPG